MSDWLSYSLSDFLLFAPETYYRQFELYNEEVWPGQIAALALGAGVAVLASGRAPWRGRAAAALLAAAWLWVAWAYLLERYDAINWAGRYFALAFALQAGLLLGAGLRFQPGRRPALALFLFALIVQPLAGPIFGRPWTQVELFALAPDPTAVGTLGVLAMARGRFVWALAAIPLAWCAIAGATLWTMGAPDALLTPAAGVCAALLLAWRRREE